MTLQSQLGSLSISEGSAQDLSKQIQRDCQTVMWEQKKMKRELEKVREQRSVLADEHRKEVLMQQRMSVV